MLTYDYAIPIYNSLTFIGDTFLSHKERSERTDMPDKSVPLSVRMTTEDMAMLSALRISEAVTPSEKLRRLVRRAHRQQEGQSDFEQSLKIEEERFGVQLHRVRALEAKHRVHSEFLLHVLGWLPDMNATAIASIAGIAAKKNQKDQIEDLAEAEAVVADRIFGLILTVLNFSLTPKAHCYRVEAVAGHLPEVLEIAKLLERKPKK